MRKRFYKLKLFKIYTQRDMNQKIKKIYSNARKDLYVVGSFQNWSYLCFKVCFRK